MKITRLELINIRNYNKLKLDFDKQISIFQGRNAQGKTNILESIYLAATGKSFRSNLDLDIIQWDSASGYIKLEFNRNRTNHQIEIGITSTEKTIKFDGKILPKRSELLGKLAMVIFIPDDLSIIKGEPSVRRRFLDNQLSQIQPAYLYNLQRYHRALKQRNQSIKEYRNGRAGLELIKIWDEQLINFGADIIMSRFQNIVLLNRLLNQYYPIISEQNNRLELKYQSGFSFPDITNKNILMDKLKKLFDNSLALEIQRGMTLTGPQRDELIILLNGRELKYFGSQGEQRSIVLTLKFAEIELMKMQLGDLPVVAMDDYMSELDDEHIRRLMNIIPADVQVLITCIYPIPDLFQSDRMVNYKIENGKVIVV